MPSPSSCRRLPLPPIYPTASHGILKCLLKREFPLKGGLSTPKKGTHTQRRSNVLARGLGRIRRAGSKYEEGGEWEGRELLEVSGMLGRPFSGLLKCV